MISNVPRHRNMDEYLAYVFMVMIILVKLGNTVAFIGYDCIHPRANVTTLSSISVAPCDHSNHIENITEERVTILQLAENDNVHVYQCKISILQTIFYCGMHSHVSATHGGITTYIRDIDARSCKQIHERGYYELASNAKFDKIRPNSTSDISYVAAGSLSSDGTCSGSTYAESGITHESVVVSRQVTVTIRDYEATLALGTNDVYLRNGITCPYLKGECSDVEHGFTMWDPVSERSCTDKKYDVLYDGLAQKAVIMSSDSPTVTIYSVNQDDTIFALVTTKEINVCYAKGFQTEHPRIVVVMVTGLDSPFKKHPMNVKNIDLFTYINSKFVYTERHIRKQMQTMYIDIIRQKCELERELLQTQLSIADISPSEFAYLRMKSPGYMAYITGEVINIVQCQQVEVSFRQTTRCYNELPISYLNKTAYLTPKSRLIQYMATEIACSAFSGPKYMIQDVWYGLSPALHVIKDPEIMKPLGTNSWVYQNPGSLAHAGIYSEKDTKNFQSQIMFPSSRQAISNTLAKVMADSNSDRHNLNMHHLLDDEVVDGIINKYWEKTWGIFSTIGQVVNGLIGMWTVWTLLKYVLDVGLHAWALYPLYGLSWKLVAIFWDTFTYCLLHRDHKKNMDQKDDADVKLQKGDEMITMPTSPSSPSSNENSWKQYSIVYNQDSKLYPNPNINEIS